MAERSIRAGRAFVELFADDTKLTRGLRNAQRRLRSFGGSISRIGKSITGVGVAAATAFVPAVVTFANFDKRISQVAAVTGATGAAFDALREKAKELGETTSFSASEAADAMIALGQAGFGVDEILAGIGPTLQLAKAGALDLGEAADIASDVGSAFGLAAEDIERVADVFARTATSANTDVQKLGETMKFAAPLAAVAGQELEGVAAAAGILGNNGIKATNAGTDLALIFKSLADSTVQDKLKKIGVETLDSAGNVRDLADVMRDLGEATKTLSEGARLDIFAKSFTRAAKSAAILSSQSGQLDTLTVSLQESQGAAAKLAEVMTDNLAGDFTAAMSAAEGALIAVGEALNATLRETAADVTGLIRTLTGWVRENQEVVVAVAKVAAGTLAAGVAMTAFGVAMTAISVAIGSTVTVFGFLGSAVGAVGAAIAALVSPAGLAAAAVVALGVAVESQTGAISAAVAAIKDQFAGVISTVQRTVAAVTAALASGDFGRAAKIGLAGLKAAFFEVMKEISDLVFDVANSFVTGFEIAWVKIRELFKTGIVDLGIQSAVAAERFKAQLSGQDAGLDARVKAIETFGEAAKQVITANANLELQAIERASTAREKLFDAFSSIPVADAQADFESVLGQFNLEQQISAAKDFFRSFEIPGAAEIDAAAQKLQDAQQVSTLAAANAVEGGGRGTFNSAAVRALFGGNGSASVDIDKTQVAIEKNTAETKDGITKVVTAVRDVATKLTSVLEFG